MSDSNYYWSGVNEADVDVTVADIEKAYHDDLQEMKDNSYINPTNYTTMRQTLDEMGL